MREDADRQQVSGPHGLWFALPQRWKCSLEDAQSLSPIDVMARLRGEVLPRLLLTMRGMPGVAG